MTQQSSIPIAHRVIASLTIFDMGYVMSVIMASVKGVSIHHLGQSDKVLHSCAPRVATWCSCSSRALGCRLARVRKGSSDIQGPALAPTGPRSLSWLCRVTALSPKGMGLGSSGFSHGAVHRDDGVAGLTMP